MNSFLSASLNQTRFRIRDRRAITRKLVQWLLAVVLFASAGCWAADNPLLGKWDIVGTPDKGDSITMVLRVQEDGGELVGWLVTPSDDIPLVDLKVEGSTFTFKIPVNANCIAELKGKVEGT